MTAVTEGAPVASAISHINLLDLIDLKKCFAPIRLIRWGETVICPKCSTHNVIKKGER